MLQRKPKRVKHNLQPSWYTKEIDEASKNRDFCRKRNDMDNYKYWRNKTKSSDLAIQNISLPNSINKTRRNPKQLWKNLHDLTNKLKISQSPLITDAHGEQILDPEKSANSFNIFFTSVSENYADDSNDLVYTDEKLKAFVKSKLSSDVNFDLKPLTLTYAQNQ